MAKVVADITMSLDGFVAGPNPTLEEPLGKNGEELHEWALESAAWREQHGLEGGETNVDSEVIAERVATVGAHVMGRKMFSGGSGPWEDDPRSMGWWGDEPPFHTRVFVLTHHAREPEEMEGGTTFLFVTEESSQLSSRRAPPRATETSRSRAAPPRFSRRWLPGSSTSCRCTWPRCCSAAALASSARARIRSGSRPHAFLRHRR